MGCRRSLSSLSLCQFFTIAEGLQVSLKIFQFVFMESLTGSLSRIELVSLSATQFFRVADGR